VLGQASSEVRMAMGAVIQAGFMGGRGAPEAAGSGLQHWCWRRAGAFAWAFRRIEGKMTWRAWICFATLALGAVMGCASAMNGDTADQTGNAARQGMGRVPAEAPDSVPAWVRADSNLTGPSAYIPVKFRKNILVVQFRREATQPQRQAAVDLVAGTVVGGHNRGSGNGIYLVRVADPGDGSRLVHAGKQLQALPVVFAASPDMAFSPN
jgi:hypothetical protein